MKSARLAPLAAVLVLATSHAYAAVIHVPDAGAGITTIAQGLAVAVPGDIVEVAAGMYTESLVINVSNVELRGVGGVTLKAPSTFPPGSTKEVGSPAITVGEIGFFRISSMTLVGFPQGFRSSTREEDSIPPPNLPDQVPGQTFDIRNSSVEAFDCVFLGSQGLPAIRAEQSTLALLGCLSVGRFGKSSYANEHGGFPSSAGAGMAAVSATSSDLHLVNSTLIGGDGGHGLGQQSIFPAMRAGRGGAAIEARADSTVTFYAPCTLFGGAGGDSRGGSPAGNGGCGISYSDTSQVFDPGVEIIPGAAGAGGPTPAVAGEPICYSAAASGVADWVMY